MKMGTREGRKMGRLEAGNVKKLCIREGDIKLWIHIEHYIK